MRFPIQHTITFYLAPIPTRAEMTRGESAMQATEYAVGDTVDLRFRGRVNYVNGDGTPDVTVEADGLYASDDLEGGVDMQNVPLACVELVKRRRTAPGDTLETAAEYEAAPIGTVIRSFDHYLVRVASGWLDPRNPSDLLRSLTMPRTVLYVPEA